jgi:NAD(P)-dependent dehydrogenase (short-subunit alcohol dehydrogenase family)
MSGAVIIGAGPGLGAALARRFAREGLPLTLIARGPAVTNLAATIEADGGTALPLRADATDSPALRTALDTAVATHGAPDALIYNAAIIQRDRPGELTHAQHLHAWEVNVLGAMEAATHLAPTMATHGGGTILLTGGMPLPDPHYTSLSLGKAALRTLTNLLDQEYRPRGIHVATVTVDAHMVPGTDSDPDLIAERYWTLHQQPAGAWEVEVVLGGGSGSG